MNYLLTLLTLVGSVLGYKYDVNEIYKCNIEYKNDNRRPLCVMMAHYRELWLQCEWPDEDPY